MHGKKWQKNSKKGKKNNKKTTTAKKSHLQGTGAYTLRSANIRQQRPRGPGKTLRTSCRDMSQIHVGTFLHAMIFLPGPFTVCVGKGAKTGRNMQVGVKFCNAQSMQKYAKMCTFSQNMQLPKKNSLQNPDVGFGMPLSICNLEHP